MAVVVMERATSRPLVVDPKAMSASREYWAQADDPAIDTSEINDAIANASPNVYLGLVKKRIKSNPIGGGFFYGTVEYGMIEGGLLDNPTPGGHNPPPEVAPTDPLGPDFAFSTAGGTQHITRSINTYSQHGAGGAVAPKTKRAIGVSNNGVAGCDIVAPKFELSITKRLAFVTMAYVNSLVECTGRVNDQPWNSIDQFAALFLGAEGRYDGNQRDSFHWLVTYKFLIGAHEFNIHLGGDSAATELKVPVKFAHDYLWVGYRPDVESTAGVVLQVPYFANTEIVYYPANFRDLLGF